MGGANLKIDEKGVCVCGGGGLIQGRCLLKQGCIIKEIQYLSKKKRLYLSFNRVP